MKTLITFLAIALLSFSANASKNLTVGFIYEKCKPLQNNGFNTKNESEDKRLNALICYTFLEQQ